MAQPEKQGVAMQECMGHERIKDSAACLGAAVAGNLL